MSYEIKVTYGCPSHGITENGQTTEHSNSDMNAIPTWKDWVPVFIDIIRDDRDGCPFVVKELNRMAEAADKHKQTYEKLVLVMNLLRSARESLSACGYDTRDLDEMLCPTTKPQEDEK